MTHWANRSTAHRRERGFTLVELMIVVTIVLVLAALAVYGVVKYIRSSKTSEAMEMINNIRGAQESYRGDTFTYLDVSGTHSLSDLSTFHPTSKPENRKYAWRGYTTDVANKWRALNVDPDAAVYFTYGCAAGASTDAVAGYQTGNIPVTVGNWPSTWGDSWYVVKAVGDLDGDGVMQQWTAANFSERVFQPKSDAE